MNVKRLARDGVLTAMAVILFVIELQIPELVPIPGVKLGLANVVTLAAMFLFGPADAAGILACRILLGGLIGGNLTAVVYSAAGGAAAYVAAFFLRKIAAPNQIWAVSVFSSLAHCLGQMAAAVLVTATPALIVYLPAMLAAGVVTGLVTGFAAQFAVARLSKMGGEKDVEREDFLKNRLTELATRAAERGRWVYSEFLTPAEQDTLLRLRLDCPFVLRGGTERAERKVACFGSEELCGYAAQAPVTCLKIEPAARKFAENLSHRDFLGSLMALGIRRETLGDIEIADGAGYLFCLGSIAPFIAENLKSVGRAAVRCGLSDPPPALSAPPPVTKLVVASERLDAVLAAVCNLSRSRARELIEKEQVFLAGRPVSSASAELKEGSIVSVRRRGRFLYEGIERETKRGRLLVKVRIYG